MNPSNKGSRDLRKVVAARPPTKLKIEVTIDPLRHDKKAAMRICAEHLKAFAVDIAFVARKDLHLPRVRRLIQPDDNQSTHVLEHLPASSKRPAEMIPFGPTGIMATLQGALRHHDWTSRAK